MEWIDAKVESPPENEMLWLCIVTVHKDGRVEFEKCCPGICYGEVGYQYLDDILCIDARAYSFDRIAKWGWDPSDRNFAVYEYDYNHDGLKDEYVCACTHWCRLPEPPGRGSEKWNDASKVSPPESEDICVYVAHRYNDRLEPWGVTFGDFYGHYQFLNEDFDFEDAWSAPGSGMGLDRNEFENVITHWMAVPNPPVGLKEI